MKNNVLLLFIVLLIAVTALMLNPGAEFEGADNLAEKAIGEINPHYEPWFEVLWEPPSSEVESLLFALQAAIGALIIGYIFGHTHARKKYPLGAKVEETDVTH